MTKKETTTTQESQDLHLIDGCFVVDRQRWGTYLSYSADGEKLITSLTESDCIAATHWYLKQRQEARFTEGGTSYAGTVDGKL